jgi:hypothetical protein
MIRLLVQYILTIGEIENKHFNNAGVAVTESHVKLIDYKIYIESFI